MTITLICLFIIILTLFVYIILNCNTNLIDIGVALFICIMFSVVGGALIVIKCDLDKPTAIDVYQGRTTLEITYRDGAPVDSVVVFKNK